MVRQPSAAVQPRRPHNGTLLRVKEIVSPRHRDEQSFGSRQFRCGHFTVANNDLPRTPIDNCEYYSAKYGEKSITL